MLNVSIGKIVIMEQLSELSESYHKVKESDYVRKNNEEKRKREMILSCFDLASVAGSQYPET